MMNLSTRKVAVIGVGNVGIAGAYAMYLGNVCDELLLVDMNKARAEGEALDLMHGQGFTGRCIIRAVDYDQLSDCQVVVVTAGINQKPGQSRLELLEANAKVFRSIAEQLDKYAPNAIIVVASNPVDVLTYMMQELSSRPNERIIGTGTMLDTTRLRTLLGDFYNVDLKSVHGYILGEHGDSEIAAWSTVTIGGKSVMQAETLGVPLDKKALEQLAVDVKNAAYKIIEGKGYTNLAIGVVISHLVDIILSDKKSIQPVSVRINGEYGMDHIALSLPARVGINGLEIVLELPLSEAEIAQLRESGLAMRESLASVGF